MTDRKTRLRRAAHRLREAHNALGELHVSDMSMEDVEDVKGLQDSVYAWKGNFEDWAEEET